MKSLFRSELSKAALLMVPLALCLGGSTAAQAEDRDPLSPGAVRPGNWNHHSESSQGYLKVYSASDVVKDGDTRYFSHSSYVIYTIDGRPFKNVKTTFQQTMKFPSSCRCQLDPTESWLGRRDAGTCGCSLLLRKISRRSST